MRRVWSVVVVVASATLLLIACGESDEEQAQETVCNARADIERRVNELAGLSLTTVSIERVRNDLQAIGDDLETIAAERDELAPEQRREVEQAAERFGSELEATARALVSGATSGEEAGERIGAALDDLANAFRDAYGPIDCD
jgi:aspartate oxidase